MALCVPTVTLRTAGPPVVLRQRCPLSSAGGFSAEPGSAWVQGARRAENLHARPPGPASPRGFPRITPHPVHVAGFTSSGTAWLRLGLSAAVSAAECLHGREPRTIEEQRACVCLLSTLVLGHRLHLSDDSDPSQATPEPSSSCSPVTVRDVNYDDCLPVFALVSCFPRAPERCQDHRPLPVWWLSPRGGPHGVTGVLGSFGLSPPAIAYGFHLRSSLNTGCSPSLCRRAADVLEKSRPCPLTAPEACGYPQLQRQPEILFVKGATDFLDGVGVLLFGKWGLEVNGHGVCPVMC